MVRSTRRGFLISMCITLSVACAICQPYEKKIVEYVRLISRGRSDLVAAKLPQLVETTPGSAGLLYVQGLIASDGTQALRCFRMVADSFPHSEWADDAIARMFEYFLSSGRRPEAEQGVARLETEYPSSPYLTTGFLTRASISAADSSRPASGEGGTEYAIQVGAFALKENAVKYREQFQAEGYRADLYENFLDGKHLLYLVWIGDYASMESARQQLPEIKTKYRVDGILRTRSSWKRW